MKKVSFLDFSKLALIVSITQAMSAVAAPPRIGPPVERIDQSTSYFLRPAVGDVSTAEVGESLYKEGIRTVSKRFNAILKSDVTSKMDNGYTLSLKAGSGGQMLMRSDTHAPLLCFVMQPTGLIGLFGDSNVLGCLVDVDKNQIFESSMFGMYDMAFALSSPAPYDVAVTETAAESPDDFHVDVLYQGTSKGEVKISYREYSKGIARPAFTQDVSYELQPDGTASIGFKGMRIKVLKATGQDIRYILEQPMPSLTKYRAESGSAPRGM